MLEIIVALIVNSIVIFLLSYILPGVKLYSFSIAVILAVVLGVINALLHHAMIFLGISTHFLVFGLISLIISGLVLYVMSRYLSGLEIDSIGWAFLFALIISCVNTLVHVSLRL